MKKSLFFIFLLVPVFSLLSVSQTYVDLTDNMQIESNSWIMINPGNYTIPDMGNDGLIQIDGKENIIIDGDGVTVDGTNYQGYMIKINNSSNIKIRHFDAVRNYYYAVYITNSDHIQINDNDFSWNKVDSTGWISIWTDYQNALGGGVMMYQSGKAQIFDNNMKFQNDGVALYHCDSISVQNNDFSWNTSFGIRMYFTDTCNIQNNNCSHVNRPFTDPSDCAAILLIVSNENYVAYNDFSFSGDGIFLGQFQYSQIPNNNYFGYNECSYSPHNAIEATFADGNVFEYNNCNYSHYGLWLGYSFNSIVRFNEINGNQYAGIAIDRGFNNLMENNEIKYNPTGILLWEGDPIPPYQDQYSQDYMIAGNNIEGNGVAVSLDNTEQTALVSNTINNNRNGIYITGDAENDTLIYNEFYNTAVYHIENRSTDDIRAYDNGYIVDDTGIIACKIFDKEDDPAYGEVLWQPFLPGEDPQFQYDHPQDMAEPDAVWYAYPEACWGYGDTVPTTVEWDYTEKVKGEASVHVATGNGWDIGVMYRPDGDSIASWALTEQDTLVFWIKSVNNSQYGFQFCNVVLGDYCGNYYNFSASASTILNPSIGQWKEIRMPLAGVWPWARTAFGDISFDDINYVEIHADTWDYGFELWIDGVTFNPLTTGVFYNGKEASTFNVKIYPNPLTNISVLKFYLSQKSTVSLSISDVHGREITLLNNIFMEKGTHKILLDRKNFAPGFYTYRLSDGKFFTQGKFIVR